MLLAGGVGNVWGMEGGEELRVATLAREAEEARTAAAQRDEAMAARAKATAKLKEAQAEHTVATTGIQALHATLQEKSITELRETKPTTEFLASDIQKAITLKNQQSTAQKAIEQHTATIAGHEQTIKEQQGIINASNEKLASLPVPTMPPKTIKTLPTGTPLGSSKTEIPTEKPTMKLMEKPEPLKLSVEYTSLSEPKITEPAKPAEPTKAAATPKPVEAPSEKEAVQQPVAAAGTTAKPDVLSLPRKEGGFWAVEPLTPPPTATAKPTEKTTQKLTPEEKAKSEAAWAQAKEAEALIPKPEPSKESTTAAEKITESTKAVADAEKELKQKADVYAAALAGNAKGPEVNKAKAALDEAKTNVEKLRAAAVKIAQPEPAKTPETTAKSETAALKFTGIEQASEEFKQKFEQAQKELDVSRTNFEKTIKETKDQLSATETKLAETEAALKKNPKDKALIEQKKTLVEGKNKILETQVSSYTTLTKALDSQITPLKKSRTVSDEGQMRTLFESEKKNVQSQLMEQFKGREKELKVLLKKETAARNKDLKESQKLTRQLEKDQKALIKKNKLEYEKALKKFYASEKKRIAGIEKEIKSLRKEGKSVTEKQKELHSIEPQREMLKLINRMDSEEKNLKDQISAEKSTQENLSANISILDEMAKPTKK